MRADVDEERAFAQLGEEDLACVRVEPPGGDVREEAAVTEEAAELEPLGLSSQRRAAAAYEEHVDAVAYGTQKPVGVRRAQRARRAAQKCEGDAPHGYAQRLIALSTA